MEAPPEILRFGPFELDEQREELRRSGLLLHLSHQPMRLLLLLVRRAGEIVTREEIQREIWGNDTYVDFEQGINAAIRQIRFHLGDNAEAPRYIRTVPRRGYVFVAAVERPPAELPEIAPAAPIAPLPSRRRWRVIAATAAFILAVFIVIAWHPGVSRGAPSPKIIAVTPFRAIGHLPDDVDVRSFTEELRATMGTLPRRSILLVEESSARRAKVRIEGTIQEERNSLRVIVSAIDAATDSRLWSETYDRPIGRRDGMAIETAHLVTQQVAQRFLPPPRHEPRLRTRVSAKAKELYRRGRMEHSRSYPTDTPDEAEKLFEQALGEQPDFSEAWSALADLWVGRTIMGPAAGRANATQRTLQYARRALALQPDNVEAQSAIGILALQRDYDLVTAEDVFRRVVAIDPDYVDARLNLAFTLIARGELEAALTEYHIARELDPVMFDLHPSEAMIYLRARRYEEALARYRDILAVRPQSRGAKWGMLAAYIAQKRWSDAIRMIDDVIGEPPPAAVAAATYEDFRREYRRLEPVVQSNYRQNLMDDYSVAAYYAELNESDRAIEALTRAVHAHAPAACYLLVDPRFDNLRSDPRYQRVAGHTHLAPTQARPILQASTGVQW